MKHSEQTAELLTTTNNQHINKMTMLFLILLPILVLGSRVSSDITASFCTIFLAIFWFNNPKHAIRNQAWFKAFLVLWLFMCVSSYFTVDPQYVFIQSFIAIRWPAFGLVLSCLVFVDKQRLRIFERAAFVFFIFIVLDSFFQYCMGYDIFGHISRFPDRLTGPFSKELPGSYGLRIYPIVIFAICTFYSKSERSKFLISILSMIILSQLFAFITGERMVFVLFGMVNLVLLIALIIQEKLSFKLITAFFATLLAAGIFSFMAAPRMISRTVISFVDQVTNFQHSSYYQVFHLAIVLWEKSPWIGVGTRYFNQSCEALPVAMHPDEGCLVHAHNIYLEWLSQSGVIGLFLFLIVLFLMFKTLLKHLNFKTNLFQSTVILIAPIMVFWPFTSTMSIQINNYGGVVWLLLGWTIARAFVMSKETKSF